MSSKDINYNIGIEFPFNEMKEVIESVIKNEIEKVIELFQKENKSVKDIFTRKEVSKMLSVSYVTLHNYKNNKTLIPFKKNGKVYYYKNDIYKYLNQKDNDR